MNRSHGGFRFDDLSHQVIGAAFSVHRELGPGWLESTYRTCLAYELSQRNLRFDRQVSVPIRYKGIRLDDGYQIDFLVDNQLIVKVHSVEKVLSVHEAQLLNGLSLVDIPLGLLINFNVTDLKKGIRRYLL